MWSDSGRGFVKCCCKISKHRALDPLVNILGTSSPLWQRHSQLTWCHLQHHKRIAPLSKSDPFSTHNLAVELTLYPCLFLFNLEIYLANPPSLAHTGPGNAPSLVRPSPSRRRRWSLMEIRAVVDLCLTGFTRSDHGRRRESARSYCRILIRR